MWHMKKMAPIQVIEDDEADVVETLKKLRKGWSHKFKKKSSLLSFCSDRVRRMRRQTFASLDVSN